MGYFTHLACSVPCGAAPFDPHERHHRCTCGAPLVACYDLDALRQSWSRASLASRPPTMWRYREVLPLFDEETPITLGEGFTPLVPARTLGRRLGLSSLFIKDESVNPTHSFKARGLSAAVTRAKALGARTLAIPSAGNAGNALAAYAARAGLQARVFVPRDAKRPFVLECLLYGADVTLVDGLITDAARLVAAQSAREGWYDVSTLNEPYRLEGKKTMGYEIAEQLGWRLPDWIIYPTGGGTGLIAMWKAFDELAALGWLDTPRRPRMVSVQAAGCAPLVRAFHDGRDRADPWEGATTVADGLRVPRALGDFLVLRTLRASGGTAVAVSDEAMIQAMLELGRLEGISAAPEGGATLAALKQLREQGQVQPDEVVVLFNTGGALKYLDLLATPPPS
jgi:threonine synthase